jgi:hypothetical protein
MSPTDTSPAALRKLADQSAKPLSAADWRFVLQVMEGTKLDMPRIRADLERLLALAAEKEAQAKQEPLFWLHCGDVYGNEQGEWEVEVNRQSTVDAITAKSPGKALPLYLAPQPSEPATLSPELKTVVVESIRDSAELVHGGVAGETVVETHCTGQFVEDTFMQSSAEPAKSFLVPPQLWTPPAAPVDVPLPEPYLAMDFMGSAEVYSVADTHRYAEAYAQAVLAAEREQIIEDLRQDAINRGGGVRRAQGWSYVAEVILKRQKGTT